MSTGIDCIVGLGNPGSKYEQTRHNAGFWLIDEIARAYGGQLRSENRLLADVGRVVIGSRQVWLVKPQTFMNESGRAVGAAMRFYNLEPDDVVVVYDELDLPPGKLRMKTGGGLAGHNGLRSIKAHIGDAFHRMRLGIGHPGHKDKVHGYVLKDFSKAELGWFEPHAEAEARYQTAAETHLSTLGEAYYARGRQRLRGLKRWAAGRARSTVLGEEPIAGVVPRFEAVLVSTRGLEVVEPLAIELR